MDAPNMPHVGMPGRENPDVAQLAKEAAAEMDAVINETVTQVIQRVCREASEIEGVADNPPPQVIVGSEGMTLTVAMQDGTVLQETGLDPVGLLQAIRDQVAGRRDLGVRRVQRLEEKVETHAERLERLETNHRIDKDFVTELTRTVAGMAKEIVELQQVAKRVGTLENKLGAAERQLDNHEYRITHQVAPRKSTAEQIADLADPVEEDQQPAPPGA